MKVKLFSTVGHGLLGPSLNKALRLTFRGSARVKNLLGHLEISISQGGVAMTEGRILRTDDKLIGGLITLGVFQFVSGV